MRVLTPRSGQGGAGAGHNTRLASLLLLFLAAVAALATFPYVTSRSLFLAPGGPGAGGEGCPTLPRTSAAARSRSSGGGSTGGGAAASNRTSVVGDRSADDAADLLKGKRPPAEESENKRVAGAEENDGVVVDGRRDDDDDMSRPTPKPRVWVSLSLCIDDVSSQLKEKGLPHKVSFPYKEAAVAASGLWSEVAGAMVAVALVTDTPDGDEATAFRDRLKKAGATAVRIVKPDAELGCVTESQMQRMYAFDDPAVFEDDIVITSDVDSFPTSTDLPESVYAAPNVTSVWMWQHYYAESGGGSLPMSFMGMKASLWRIATSLMLDGLDGQVQKSNHWGNDQFLLTRSILRLKLCNVNSKTVWTASKLKREPFDDGGRCFKGTKEWSHGAVGSWKWVHFTPGHNATDVRDIAALILRQHRKGEEGKGKAFGLTQFHRELSDLWEKNKKITVVALPRPGNKGKMKMKANPISRKNFFSAKKNTTTERNR